MYQIFIISDSTGRTAEQAIRAALVQFSETEVALVHRSGIRSKDRVQAVLKEAADAGGSSFTRLFPAIYVARFGTPVAFTMSIPSI